MKFFSVWLLVVVAMTLQACTTETEETAGEEAAVEPVAESAEPAPDPRAAIEAAIANIPDRPADDAARDAGRKPAEVLAFLGLEPGMTVIDVFAAGGWYSEVLAAAVGPDGRVIIQNPLRLLELRDGMFEKQLSARLEAGRLGNVSRMDMNVHELGLEPGSVDFALTALNVHDMYYLISPEVAAGTLASIHALLKPGGVLGVIDHVGAPDADNATLHRIDAQIVKDMAVAAGFVVEAESGILHNYNDDLTQVVFAPEIRGKTHRFVLRLRKP